MVWFFGKKKKDDELRIEVQESFGHVKQDFNKVGEWIKHLDGKGNENTNEISIIKDQLLTMQEELNEMREVVSFFKPEVSHPVFKQSQTVRDKQALPVAVQTVVQTAVQTSILDNLTVMERAIVWALLNSDMKLSYEDIAALLGKEKSTIRGQINAIKQKNEGLIEEYREVSGKKRIYIPEEVKGKIMKTVKLKVNGQKKPRKEKSESYNG